MHNDHEIGMKSQLHGSQWEYLYNIKIRLYLYNLEKKWRSFFNRKSEIKFCADTKINIIIETIIVFTLNELVLC
jgi:hypothetical protein